MAVERRLLVQLPWDARYLFVDGASYRTRRDYLVLARGARVLPQALALQVLRRVAREDARMLQRLRDAFGAHTEPRAAPLTADDPLLRMAGASNGIALPGAEAFAALLVLEHPTLSAPPAVPIIHTAAPIPPSLAELRATISLALLDEWGNPLKGGVAYELTTADNAQRSGSFDGSGEARESGVQPGAAELSLPDLAVDDWMLRAAPPDGWLRKTVSVQFRDAAGEPIGATTAHIEFANGAVLSQELDASGTCRLDGTPSWPMKVTFPDFDPESYD